MSGTKPKPVRMQGQRNSDAPQQLEPEDLKALSIKTEIAGKYAPFMQSWFDMAKNKMPPQLLEYFKNKGEKNKDGKEMSDKEKRKAALDKARKYKEQKGSKKEKWVFICYISSSWRT